MSRCAFSAHAGNAICLWCLAFSEAGWDQAILGDAVLIHEIGRTNPAFTYAFHLAAKVVGSGREGEIEWVPPSGTIGANGIPEKAVWSADMPGIGGETGTIRL